MHALVLIAWKSFNCMEANCAMFTEMSTIAVAGIAMFMAVLFGLFVLVMFCD
jgi:hypothetical protein